MKNSSLGKTNKLSIMQQIGGIFGFILGLMLVNYLGTNMTLIILVPLFLGTWGAAWYLKREHFSKKTVSVIVWSSLVTGLILPPIGLLTSSAAYTFGNKLEPKINKYKIIGVVGILLALANGGLGIYLRLYR